MELPPLVPNVKRKKWRAIDASGEDIDQEYIDIRRQMLIRDKYTCRYCGFKTVPMQGQPSISSLASGFLEGHHINNDHSDNRLDNLITVCPFCHLPFHIGNAGYRERAKGIYVPNPLLTQERLNLMVNCLAVAEARSREEKSQFGQQAIRIYLKLDQLSIPLKNLEDNINLSDLKDLSGALMLLGEGFSEKSNALQNFRILPCPEAFGEAVNYWSNSTWLPGQGWEKQWEAVHKNWKENAQ